MVGKEEILAEQKVNWPEHLVNSSLKTQVIFELKFSLPHYVLDTKFKLKNCQQITFVMLNGFVLRCYISFCCIKKTFELTKNNLVDFCYFERTNRLQFFFEMSLCSTFFPFGS